MSIQAVAWAISQKVGSPTGKVLLICLANYADEDGLCWPSQKTIAAETELSDRSTILWLKKLEEDGYILRERRHRRDGSRTTDHIRLQLHKRPKSGENDLTAESAGRPELDASDAKPTCTSAQTYLQEMHPKEPSVKPSIEPPSTGARALEGNGFDLFWEDWPSAERPKKKQAAKWSFDRLSKAEQASALKHAKNFRRLMKARESTALMIPYFKNRLFEELVDGPEVSADGNFVFKPNRPEWRAWLDYLKSKYSAKASADIEARGIFVDPRRWPPIVSSTMSGSAS